MHEQFYQSFEQPNKRRRDKKRQVQSIGKSKRKIEFKMQNVLVEDIASMFSLSMTAASKGISFCRNQNIRLKCTNFFSILKKLIRYLVRLNMKYCLLLFGILVGIELGNCMEDAGDPNRKGKMKCKIV